MNEPTQIIVFSNPATAMFWNSIMYGNGLIIFLVVFIAGIFWAVLYDKLYKLFNQTRFTNDFSSVFAGWISFLITAAILFVLHLHNIS